MNSEFNPTKIINLKKDITGSMQDTGSPEFQRWQSRSPCYTWRAIAVDKCQNFPFPNQNNVLQHGWEDTSTCKLWESHIQVLWPQCPSRTTSLLCWLVLHKRDRSKPGWRISIQRYGSILRQLVSVVLSQIRDFALIMKLVNNCIYYLKSTVKLIQNIA